MSDDEYELIIDHAEFEAMYQEWRKRKDAQREGVLGFSIEEAARVIARFDDTGVRHKPYPVPERLREQILATVQEALHNIDLYANDVSIRAIERWQKRWDSQN